jgi:CheY-like chemotaxis protein
MAGRRILIADDHAAVRRSLRSLLESHPDWELCGEATNGREAVELALRLEPDVVLLDMTMPELNGLEATRRILKAAPDTHVLLLTMYESEELTEEALRAGAQGVILKSGGDEMLARIEALSKYIIHLGGQTVGRSRHVAVFLRSDSEFDEVLGPFIAEGLAQGEKAIHIVAPPTREVRERRLREAGIDVDQAISKGQLEVFSWNVIYQADGRFDKDAMLERLRRVLLDRIGQRFPMGRLVAHMEWAREQQPGVNDLAEFEAEADRMLSKFDDVAVCVYDLAKFPANTIVDVLRGHPCVVIAGSMHSNPFYTPPDILVQELRHRASH